ncbi:Oxygen-insensitive NAD(P)H nitroreductase [Kingella potus]|uniref:Oxygen-insensitive NAD(P)H nitroreductase n=1 Tax=Kingella potus TaxID=265175 RepID=A0A377R2H1_9NEIS|nr:oxygen-insensitive NAD(P)H nitroreductase [Kingella potus]UOP00419.1 oxygen-insensitive NAD(P)H nitroreductase [Kingella potus]STR02513.1 Oxygen-insensitive NAD(P)H nitroreductase [Kingella potus]
MNVKNLSENRYSTKKFDPTKKISADDFAQIKAALRNAPSSVNIQPWHFVIADDDAGKARIAKSAENFPYNREKITNASHVVVFAARKHADDAYVTAVVEQEDQDGRFATAEAKAAGDDIRRVYVGYHREQFQDESAWLAKQVHINLGFVLFAAAALGIDAVPMEGVDMKVLNQEFGLNEKGYTAVAVVPFGYRAADDYNAALPKSRFAEEVIFSKA